MPIKFQDYYKTLGVSRDASQDQIQSAYRKLARKYHPDLNKDDDHAADQFKVVTEAYEVLKDPDKRKKYNQLGADWKAGQDFNAPPGWQDLRSRAGSAGAAGGFSFSQDSFSDFFESLFGAAHNGQEPSANLRDAMHRGQFGQPAHAAPRPQEANVTISIDDAYHGGSKQITLQSHLHGQPSGPPTTFHVKIPPGTTDGTKIRLAGGKPGGPPTDVLLKITLAPHPHFKVSGHDLHTTLLITPWEAALGAKIPIHTPSGQVTLTVPPGAQSGQKLRLRDKGLPQRNHDGKRGSLLAQIKIVVPETLTDKERELFESLKDESSFDPRKELSPPQ